MKITYRELAEMTNKTKDAYYKMEKNNPEQLELIKMGALCKKYDISIDTLKLIVMKRETK